MVSVLTLDFSVSARSAASARDNYLFVLRFQNGIIFSHWKYLPKSYSKIFERSRNIEGRGWAGEKEDRKGDPAGRPYGGRYGGLPFRGQTEGFRGLTGPCSQHGIGRGVPIPWREHCIKDVPFFRHEHTSRGQVEAVAGRLRPLDPGTFRMIPPSARKASLTVFAFGNIRTTSGSSTTTLVPRA